VTTRAISDHSRPVLVREGYLEGVIALIVVAVVLLLVLAGAVVDIRDRRSGHRIRSASEIGATVRVAKREARARMRSEGLRARKARQHDAEHRGRQQPNL
jgi:hypothetical protein